MANDMQWPSEDEDFDAVIAPPTRNGKSAQPAAPVAEAAKPSRTVAVAVDEPDEQSSAEEEPEQDPVEAAFNEEPDEQEQPEPSAEPEPASIESEEPEHQEPEQPEPEHSEPATPEPSTEQGHEYPTPPAAIPSQPKAPRNSSAMTRTVLEGILVLALLGLGYFTYTLNKDKQDLTAQTAQLNSQITTLKANPQLAVQKQTDDLIAKVGALVPLPTGETPTVANVSDAEKAKQQSSFFANAQNGDRVLLYAKAGKAILYRPSTNKVVLVAPLTFNNDTTTDSTTPGTSATTNAKPSR